VTSPHSDRAGRLPRWAFALGVILALGALASSAFAQPMLLTGADRAVWLVRIRDANTFDVLAKPAGDAWRWVASDLRGQPVAIAADTGLRMICHGGDQLFFALGGGSPTPAAKISAGSVVALCGAADSSRSEPLTYAVVVQRVPPTATARAVLQPATATRPGELVRLGVYRGSGDAWSRVADTDVLEHFPGTRVLAAALGKTVYVLAGDDRAQRLFAVQDGSSRPVQLPPPAPSRRPLGMLAMSGRVLLILAEPAEKPDQVVVRIATYDPAKGFNEPLHPMTRDGQLVTWPMNDPPLPARLADRIALVWREGQRLRFTTCSDKGVLAPSEDVDVLEHPPVPGGAQDVLYYFLWGTVIATTIPLLLSRPTSPPRPLTLPAYMQPAGLLKRLLACLIDLVPFLMVGGLVFMPNIDLEKIRDRRQLMEAVNRHSESAEAAYALVLSLSLYVVYCTIMEYRLGATLGKMALRQRVVGQDGQRLLLREALIRNLWKIIELLGLRLWQPLWPILLIIPFISRMRQRLGDVMARTVVVESAPAPMAPPPPADRPDDSPQDRDDKS
jgi:uncharacterized RDD family membrane protein YckC